MSSAFHTVNSPLRSSILLVDDHPILRDGFAQLINHEPDLHVYAQADSVPEAMAAIETRQPDLAIVDISLQGADGIELIKNLKSRFSGIRILVLSMYDERVYAERAFRAGANGYVTKQAPTERVMEAIRRILQGRQYFSEEIESYLLQKLQTGGVRAAESDVACLTDREMGVLMMIGKGLRTEDIATGLRISAKTVDSHRRHLKQKLGCKSSVELMRRAVEWVSSTDR